MSRVAELLRADADLMERKSKDYAPNPADPFENFRTAAQFAEKVSGRRHDAIDACLILVGVKISRLETVGIRAVASNEALTDTLRDLRVYLAIAEAMLEERK